MMVVARVHCELHLCKTMEVVVVMAGATVETFGVLQNASWCVTTQLTLEKSCTSASKHTCAFSCLQ